MQPTAVFSLVLFFFSCWSVDGAVQRIPRRKCLRNDYNETIYDYKIGHLSGDSVINLADYVGKQEPGKNFSEIMNGIKYVRPGNGFIPNFPLTEKIDVNGENEHPMFTYLKKYCPSTRDGFSNKHELFYAPFKNWDVRWNFEKFLVDAKGYPYLRYDPSTEPILGITSDIEAIIHSEN